MEKKHILKLSVLLCFVSLLFNTKSFSGVPITLNKTQYESFITLLDNNLQKLPFNLSEHSKKSSSLILPSKTKINLTELQKMISFTNDQLIDYLSNKKLKIIIVCSKRKNYIQKIKSHKCMSIKKVKEFKSHRGILNAMYVSKYIKSNKFNKAYMIVRNDAPKITILHEYIHHLQETKSPTVVKSNYSFKSIRVALADSLFEIKKKTKTEELLYKELYLTQPLLDELENYEAMLLNRKAFKLNQVEINEILSKLNFYIKNCKNKNCNKKRKQYQNISSQIRDRQIIQFLELTKSYSIETSLLEKSVNIKKNIDFNKWYSNILLNFLNKYNLVGRKQNAIELLKSNFSSKYTRSDREQNYNKIYSWMAINILIKFKLSNSILRDYKDSLPKEYRTKLLSDIKLYGYYLKKSNKYRHLIK